MAMRMPPEVAAQPVVPGVNRTSLVLFAGLALIGINLYWQNGTALAASIFHPGTVFVPQVTDAGIQVLGLALLTLLAQYGGENAGTAALMFVGALWLLWLLMHIGTRPKSEPISRNPVEGVGTPPVTTTKPGQTGPR